MGLTWTNSSENFLAHHEFAFYWEKCFFNTYILLPICATGFVINVLAAAFLRFLVKSGPSVRVFLLALTVLDALQLGSTWTLPAVPCLCDQLHANADRFCRVFRIFLEPVLGSIVATIDTVHLWTLTALTVHRYWKIAYPFHALIHDTAQRSRMFIAMLCVAAFLFRTPMFLQNSWSYSFIKNTTTFSVRPFAKSPTYGIIYYAVLNTALYNILPFTILTVLNCLILKKIYNATTANILRKNLVIRRRELRAAMAVSFIVSVFLVFHMLFMYDVIKKLVNLKKHAKWGGGDKLDSLLDSINNVLISLSSALNPFIYITLGHACRMFQQRWSAGKKTSSKIDGQGTVTYLRLGVTSQSTSEDKKSKDEPEDIIIDLTNAMIRRDSINSQVDYRGLQQYE